MTGLFSQIGAIASSTAAPHEETASMVRTRRIIVVVVLIIGATVLGLSFSSQPGSSTFYLLTVSLALVWAIGARLSGPLHIGYVNFRGKNRRPIFTGIAVGVVLGGVFIVGGLVAREIGPVRDYIVEVLDYANYGALWLVAIITDHIVPMTTTKSIAVSVWPNQINASGTQQTLGRVWQPSASDPTVSSIA